MKEISFMKADLNEENINIFISIQNSVANPKTFRMGYVTEKKASDRFNDAEVLFIKKDDKIVGILEYQLGTNNYAYIKSMAILPEFQGQNIGRQSLLLLLNNYLRHISRIGLNTHPENKALILYQSIGFVITKKIPGNKILGYEPSFFLILKRHA